MKRIIFLALALAASYSMTNSAKERKDSNTPQHVIISGGPLLEINRSGFIHPGHPDGRSRMKVGVTGGGFIDFEFNRFFSLQGDLLLHYKNSDYTWNEHNGNYRHVGLEIPLYAMFHYEFDTNMRIYAGIGPYTNFGLKASFNEGGRKMDVYAKDADTGMPIMYTDNHGFGIRIGYEIERLQVNLNYKASITNILDPATAGSVRFYPHMASIGLAYRFGGRLK